MDSQEKKVCNITKEQLDKGIIAFVAALMVEHSKRLAKRAKILQAATLASEACYIAMLALYMLYRHHHMGALLVAVICATYDGMQCALNEKDYPRLATFAGFMFGASFSYIWMDGKAIHLCGAVFGIFLFRYAQLWISKIAKNASDILDARQILIREGLGDNDKLIITTRQHKQYVYEWDKAEIIKYLESRGETQEPAEDVN